MTFTEMGLELVAFYRHGSLGFGFMDQIDDTFI